jgi:hypothetical protein
VVLLLVLVQEQEIVQVQVQVQLVSPGVAAVGLLHLFLLVR